MLVQEYILKLILGPSSNEHPDYETRKKEYKQGLLDEYSSFVHIPPSKRHELSSFSLLKVKDIRTYLYDVYLEQIFKVVDFD